jgi:ssRNA-specific RNase YbeY (16S rRNA maturation enzyme)
VSGTDDGTVRVESLEWENVNMIWEDFSKQLITEPQAFIVGSITNDASMTVTRQYRGRETPTDGITDAEYRL